MNCLPRFVHHQPTALDEAVALAAQHGDRARILAGGTELLPKMRAGRPPPEHLISINRVEALRAVDFDEESGLVIGAGARIRDVADHPAVRQHYPALAQACTLMATVQIRNMATVAGNLANGSPCADTAGPLLVHDARVSLVAQNGTREVPLAEFFVGPGQVDVQVGEILASISVPRPSARTGSSFLRLSARSQVDIAAASASARLDFDGGGVVREARIAVGAVAPTPLRCEAAEALLVDQTPDAAGVARAAAEAAAASRPISDVRATAAYRRAVLPVLVRRVLEAALAQGQGGAS